MNLTDKPNLLLLSRLQDISRQIDTLTSEAVTLLRELSRRETTPRHMTLPEFHVGCPCCPCEGLEKPGKSDTLMCGCKCHNVLRWSENRPSPRVVLEPIPPRFQAQVNAQKDVETASEHPGPRTEFKESC